MTISIRAEKWFLLTCWILFLTGSAVVGGMLLAPAGVWLHWWPYTTGFAIVGVVHPLTAAAAITVLMLGLVLYLLGQRLNTNSTVGFLWLHLIVALGCGLAWYLPLSSQIVGSQKYPPIHDISTDLSEIPQFDAIILHRIDASTTTYGGSPNMTPERNAQLQQEFYPDLVSHYYDLSANDMYYRAYSAAIDMRWSIVAASPEEGRIEATATTFWFRLKEDIVIRIRTEGGKTRVDARSLSRVGGSDDGTNARRLRKFFQML